jgi:hypothetical protein
MYMFEFKVYECQACHEFFCKLDADEHTRRTSHSDFKVTDWTSPAQSSPRLNRGGGKDISTTGGKKAAI